MYRIEVFGPPGIGKSTVVKAAMGLAAGRFFSLRRLMQPGTVPALWTDFERFVAAAYEGMAAPDRIHQRRMLSTRRALQKARIIAAVPSTGVILTDESLCQRGLSLALSRPRCDDVVRGYFAAMPVPRAAIVFACEPAVVVERNVRRGVAMGKSHDRSADVSATTSAADLGAAMLRARGVPVEIVDASRPVAVLAGQVADFVAGHAAAA